MPPAEARLTAHPRRQRSYRKKSHYADFNYDSRIALPECVVRGGIDTAVVVQQAYDVPSNLVSAHGDLATRNRAVAANTRGFVEKPLTPEALANAIEQVLNAAP